jgi:hypothetical protein
VAQARHRTGITIEDDAVGADPGSAPAATRGEMLHGDAERDLQMRPPDGRHAEHLGHGEPDVERHPATLAEFHAADRRRRGPGALRDVTLIEPQCEAGGTHPLAQGEQDVIVNHAAMVRRAAI